MKQLLLEILQPAAPTLDNFVVAANAELIDWLDQCLQQQASERFAYLWGAAGSGKTHLLKGTVARALERQLRAIYIPANQADDSLVNLESLDLVAVDGVERLSRAGQTALMHLYNRMRERSGRLLISGASAPIYLGMREDLASRLSWGLVFQVHLLDDEEKVAALIRHAQTRGFKLSSEVARHLLRHARRDLPSLMLVLDALDRYSLETKRPISLAMLREVLQPDLPG